MIDTMAQRIASFLVEKGAAASDDIDVQIYGWQVILSTSLNLTVALLVCLIMGQFPFGVAFLATFMLLRRITGGYHASSYLICFLSMQALILLGLSCQILFYGGLPDLAVYAMTVISTVLVFLLAPIDHVNKPSTPASRRKFRLLSRIMTLLVAACILWGLSFDGWREYAIGILMGLFATGILLVVAKIQKKGGALS